MEVLVERGASQLGRFPPGRGGSRLCFDAPGGTTKPRYVGRPEYASTAAGLMSQHNAELKAFLNEALAL